MNVERMLLIADLIEANAISFNMKDIGNLFCDQQNHVCGTPGCIAGFAMSVLRTEPDCRWDDLYLLNTYEWLDLTHEEGRNLCYANFECGHNSVWLKYHKELELPLIIRNMDLSGDPAPYVQIHRITASMAITMLRNLASGEWSF